MYGMPTASARQMPAAPADWIDLSVRTISRTSMVALPSETGALTEAGEMRELGGVIRHCTHEPIRSRLPHRVQQAAEYVQPYPRSVACIVYVETVILARGHSRARILSGSGVRVEVDEGQTHLTSGRSMTRYAPRIP